MAHHLQLLGQPTLFDAEGRVCSFRTRKQLGVLVVLFLDGRGPGVRRDTLVEYFWPDVAERNGRHSLAQALSVIRATLGPDAVSTNGELVRLAAAVTSDMDRPGTRANGGGGPDDPAPVALDSMERVGGVEWSHWVDGARTRVVRAVRRTLTEEIETSRSNGHHQTVNEHATLLYRIDRTNHTAVHLLAEQAAEAGRTGEAVELLEGFLSRQRDRPDASRVVGVRRLLTRIQAGNRTTSNHSEPRRTPTPPFVGRAEELRQLQSIWNSLDDTPTRTVLVSGPSGIGKTALVQRFAQFVAADGHLVVRATCQPVSREIPFSAITALIEDMSNDPELGATDPHWLTEASRIAPFLRTRFSGLSVPEPLVGDLVRMTAAEAFYQLLSTIASTGRVLLVIDDVDAIDPISRDILTLLLERPRTFSCVVLCTCRANHASGEAMDAVPVSVDSETTRIGVGAMEDRSIEQIARVDGDKHEVTGIVVELANGVPLYAIALMKDWEESGSDSLVNLKIKGEATGRWLPGQGVRRILQRRIGRFTDTQRIVIHALSVAGRPMSADMIAEITGLYSATVRQTVMHFAQSGDLDAHGDSVAFKNAVFRAFTYHQIPKAQKVLLHGTIASVLAKRVGGESTALLEIARHLRQAGRHDSAFKAACDGAQIAIKEGASAEAERAARSAIRAYAGDCSRAIELTAEALMLAGKYEDAARWLQYHFDIETSNPYQELLALEAMFRASLYRPERLRGRMDRLVQLVSTGRIEHRYLDRALTLIGEHAASERSTARLAQISSLAAQTSRGVGESSSSQCKMTSAFCALCSGDYARAFREFSTLIHGSCVPDLVPNELMKAHNGQGIAAWAMGEANQAYASFEAAIERARQLGDHGSQGNLYSNVGAIHVDLARVHDAEACFERSLADLHVAAGSKYHVAVRVNLADHLLVVGRFDDALLHLQRAKRLAQDHGTKSSVAEVELGLADWCLAQGRPDEARDHLENALADVVDPKDGNGKHIGVHAFDPPNFLRSIRLLYWFTGNYREAMARPSLGVDGPMPVSAFVELVALVEWFHREAGTEPTGGFVAPALVRATGLFGVVNRLKRLGVVTPGVKSA